MLEKMQLCEFILCGLRALMCDSWSLGLSEIDLGENGYRTLDIVEGYRNMILIIKNHVTVSMVIWGVFGAILGVPY